MVDGMAALNNYPYSGHSALIGRKKRNWQDTEYVLNIFGNNIRQGKNQYLEFVKSGMDQGHRDDLTGGGLIRSMGGWSEVKKMRRKNSERIKGDERILGDGDFVDQILSEARDNFERRYELKRKGFDFKKVCDIVCDIFEMDLDALLSKGRQQQKVTARSLICYWSVCELKMTVTELARIFDQRPSTISYAVERGKTIADRCGYSILSGD